MKWLAIILLLLISAFWILPSPQSSESAARPSERAVMAHSEVSAPSGDIEASDPIIRSKSHLFARRINRLLIGLWFICIGYLFGPTFLGKLMRMSPFSLFGLVLIVAAAIGIHEMLLNRLFPDVRSIIFYLPPSAVDLGLEGQGIPLGTRMLALLQGLLAWGITLGLGLIYLYVTARFGSLFSSKTNTLLAESSFTIYVFHFPILTMIFASFTSQIPHGITAVLAVIYAAILSVPLCSLTKVIRNSIWLRFWVWYKV